MPKAGKLYELVVADIVKEMDPGAIVIRGEWIEGPDGRRDIDVLVDGFVDGVRRRVNIECKDFNPKRKNGKIKIPIIDALDSKHRDLGYDLSLLCTNAGFTTPAISKARRLGIGLIGALRSDDPRVKYKIIDEIYFRRVDFLPNSADFQFIVPDGPPKDGTILFTDFTFQGIPLVEWLRYRAQQYVAFNYIVSGKHRIRFRLKQPLAIKVKDYDCHMTELSVQFGITGGWFAQQVEIDANSGLYDWLRKTIQLTPGPGQISYKNVDFDGGGMAIDMPPDLKPGEHERKVGGVGIDALFSSIQSFKDTTDIPALNDQIEPEDLEATRSDIPVEAYYRSEQ
ncbi:MAG: restriction endonuclease [Sneathiellales bacterium]|nr:restriction endonuclease [Sneathiellales bacterium]